jgi:hypothetical protein
MELKVPTHATVAEVVLSDKRTLNGRVFIPISSSQHSGPMRPDEWLNLDRPFFPFLADDSKATVLLNKEQVAVLSIAASAEEEPTGAEIPERLVIVETPDRRIEGTVRIDMPSGRQRLLDWLNRAEPFLLLRAPFRWHLVRKSLITRVIEHPEP